MPAPVLTQREIDTLYVLTDTALQREREDEEPDAERMTRLAAIVEKLGRTCSVNPWRDAVGA